MNKVKQMLLKYVKYGGIFLAFLAFIPIFWFSIVFISYRIEAWEAERMIINDYEEPLTVGETWEEEPFSFTLEQVKFVNDKEWQTQSSFSLSKYKSYDFDRALELEFSFIPKETDEKLDRTYTFYPMAHDIDGHLAGPLPLPSNLEGNLTIQNQHYVILTTKDAHVVQITVNVPYGEKKYRKIYEFYINDI